MIYRSPFTRWFLAAVGIVAGSVFAFGDEAKWRSTPSFDWLSRLPVPLQFWGAAFIVYGLLLLVERTRPIGFALGAFLFALFAVSLLATLKDEGPKNVFVIAGLLDVTVFHVFSIRTAWAQKLAN